jgi:hypothetical protein
MAEGFAGRCGSHFWWTGVEVREGCVAFAVFEVELYGETSIHRSRHAEYRKMNFYPSVMNSKVAAWRCRIVKELVRFGV